MATGLAGRRGRREPGRVGSALTGKQGWPAGPGLWSESASLGSDWLPASRDLAMLLWWTRQESLERPKELCKPLPENKISEGRADPPEALLRGSPSQVPTMPAADSSGSLKGKWCLQGHPFNRFKPLPPRPSATQTKVSRCCSPG